MKKPRSNRLMSIESLENRVVFAEDLVMIDVNLLVQWNVITQDSDFAIEHRNSSVPISRERLALLGEGEWYSRELSGASLQSHAITASLESLPSLSPSFETNTTLHQAIGTANHPTESSVAIHLATGTSAVESSTPTIEAGALDATPFSNAATSAMDSITEAIEEGVTRSLGRVSPSSTDFNMQFLDEVFEIQAARPLVTTESATRQNEPRNSFEMALDESFGSPENRQSSGGNRALRSSVETRLEKRRGTLLFEDGQKDLFAKSIYVISLPDANQDPAAQSWSLLFGVVRAGSSWSDHLDDSERNSVRKAVLEIVAESEGSDLPVVDPPSTHLDNTWKATSILAAALTAAFYRTRWQQDEVPSLLARIRKQRVPSNRSRR